MAGLPPGARPRAAELEARLEEAVARRGPRYRPRTRHKLDDGSARYVNRLALETSPYLLQHAHNPVDWYPWGAEAFDVARREGRPVFLSIGYSTCHWCHVMEEESFEDEEIARTLNERYVAVKVDREERPDVDAVYMAAVQALAGQGGWPMSVWLTSEKEPYFAATYLPPRDGDRGARFGFLTLLARMRELYDDAPERVARSAAGIAEAVRAELAASRAGDLPGEAVLDDAMATYRRRFDPDEGGLEVQMKFPSQLPIRFLLRYWKRRGDEGALAMARLTLEKMAAGGICDHVGGGFHRYSTDPQWLVPHFEKMLYDNALLCVAYLEGWQATGDDGFARVAREILRYVERDMTSDAGGFYSATDADSLAPSGEREEGWFFTWTPAELEAELGRERAGRVAAYYAVTEGRSILHAPRPLADVAAELALSPDVLRHELDEAREQLYRARRERPPPLRDEKILCAWNGLMISASAKAALAFDDERWAALGARAASFVLEHMRDGDRLFRSYKDGAPRHAAFLDDYAFLCAGLLDLFEATGEKRWLDEAFALDRAIEQRFEDTQEGGFFMTSGEHEELLVRERPSYDGAEPSGASVHAQSLARLHALTGDDDYRVRLERTLRAYGEVLEETPTALAEMLVALDWFLDEGAKEILLLAPHHRDELFALVDVVRSDFVPNRVLVIAREGDAGLPLVDGRRCIDGRPTAFVCRHGVCARPTTSPDELAASL